jgi:tricorn protease
MRFLLAALLLFFSVNLTTAEDKPCLLQKPTISKTQVAFVYAGDLWIVGREGGDAKRLTTGVGLEYDPLFSPDGSQIAFTGEYDGNIDVYVVPAAGGVPRRLTYHPGIDVAVSWSPDGKSILFRSDRASASRFNKLFSISVGGTFPTELPLPMAEEGSLSPDGTHLAYVPYWNRRSTPNAYIAWKRYRGGKASPIWLANLADSSIEKLPREDSNDWNPLWVGDKVYFLSDRNGPTTLFSYDTRSKRVSQIVSNSGADIDAANAGPDAIVYEQFGSLNILDLPTGNNYKLNVRVNGDFPAVRQRYEKVGKKIRAAHLSPTGARAVFEARGEILTVPADKGDVRNLTQTPGVAERDPAWSPDGKSIAYFSDESGEYALHIRDQRGTGAVKKIDLGSPPSYFYGPVWSPDSKKIAYTDKRLNLWYVELDKGKPVKVDTDTYDAPQRTLDPVWSSDSKWIAYTKRLKSHLHAVLLYSIEAGKPRQLTDGMSDARFPAFDKNGKYLYFTASTDVGPTTGWLDMSSFNHPVTRSAYVVVLNKDLPSPLAPESDEEKALEAEAAKKPDVPMKPIGKDDAPPAKAGDKIAKPGDSKETAKKEATATGVRIDFEDIDQRILALPIPARNYVSMTAGKSGVLFLTEAPSTPRAGAFGGTLYKFELDKRKTDKLLDNVTSLDISANGEKVLYRTGIPDVNDHWYLVSTALVLPGQGMLTKVDDMEVLVDPKAEWQQMYREVWRIERDFLYDPNAHGLDLRASAKKYEAYLDNLASRSDLNYLFNEMLGELVLGHTYVGGGDNPEVKKVKGGLLGADYKIENGRYRIAKVYRGENWNPQLRAPLTQPGVNVKAGEYLLAVNGRDLKGTDNLYKPFEATAGKAVILKVGPNADGSGSREVTVVPVESETSLRNLAWIDDNRRKVDQLSGGKLAYVYLPDTSVGGYTNFNRYYFAQVDKEGAVIDERFNGGGTAADYIIDYMRRPLMNYWTTREGSDFTTPVGSIFGPKVMIINEFAGSGGDAMPWYFRTAKVGPLVGKRTWGGLVGIYDYPQLIDGGMVTAPRLAFWNPKGDWEVENHGVGPDVEVELDPKAMREGHDPQLEKAVAVALEELKKHPLPTHRKPAYPNYYNGKKVTTAESSGKR